jgi:hypothetical protein
MGGARRKSFENAGDRLWRTRSPHPSPDYTDGRDWPDEIEPTFTLGSCNTPRTAGKTGKWCGFGRKAT